jgi:hypothetical protein
MDRQGALDRSVTRSCPGQPLERARIVVETKGRPAVVQFAEAKGRGSRRPDRAVADDFFGAQIRTERDQFGKVADRLDRADLFEGLVESIHPRSLKGMSAFGRFATCRQATLGRRSPFSIPDIHEWFSGAPQSSA